MATYSLAVTGVPAGSFTANETLTLPDDNAVPGDMLAAMQNGTQMLCRGQDGSLAWYVLDPQRSTPTVPVLVKV